MKRSLPSLSLFALVLGHHTAAYGGALHKVWEIDLGDQITSAGEAGIQPGILALGFSPDGKEIAVAGNPYLFHPAMSRLLVLNVEHPKDHIRQFAVTGIPSDSTLSEGVTPAISWSPAGDLIIAGANLIRLRDGSTCQIADAIGQAFISADRLVAQTPLKKNSPPTLWEKLFEKSSPKQLVIFDSNCNSAVTWQGQDAGWTLADASPQRGLLAMLRENAQDTGRLDELLLIDAITRKIVHTWSSIESAFTARFAALGTAVCTGDNANNLYEARRVSPRCLDIDTGETIATARGINGGAPLAAAEHGLRVIVSDYSQTWNRPYQEYDTTLKRRVVWDFRKNEEIASWRPDMQSYTLLGGKPAKDPSMFAISPDGEYMAEGGGGILRLYRIVP